MRQKLLLPLLLLQAISAQAWFSNNQIDQRVNQTNDKLTSINDKLQGLCGEGQQEATEKESNRLWHEIVNQLNNATINGPENKIELVDRGSVSVGQKSASEATSNGKYLGIDKWRLGAGLSFFHTQYADLGLSAAREVTFIQQFPSRCKSLARIGYDPVTKIPLNSERAMNRLKPGDFVAFSAPLTLNLGKGFGTFIERTELTRTLGGVNLYASGEFNIHVYRMDNNYVRVRFFAAKTKGVSFNPGLKFYALSGLVKVTLIEAKLGTALTNLFSADYVFNLNDEQSRSMYDKVMGEKFQLEKSIGLTDAINPFTNNNEIQKTLFSDLTGLEEVSIEDSKKPLSERRIIRLSQGKTDTSSKLDGLGFDLKILKFRDSSTESESTISIFDVEDKKQNYAIKAVSKEKNYEYFNLWGQSNTYNTALLLELNNNNNNIVSSLGLQNIRIKEDLALSKDELSSLKNSLMRRLPKQITSILNFPDNLTGEIYRSRIYQSIFFDSKKIESQKSITYDSVESELKNLIVKWGKIDSLPQGISTLVSNKAYSKLEDPRIKDFKDAQKNILLATNSTDTEDKKRFLNEANKKLFLAYKEELKNIPKFLSGLFSNKEIKEKIEDYNNLKKIPLFQEMGAYLVLNLISKADDSGSTVKMEDIVSYHLSITGRGLEPKITEYPIVKPDELGRTSINLNKSEAFVRILNDNAYINDRSFNLYYYINEKGESLSLKEVVDSSTHNK